MLARTRAAARRAAGVILTTSTRTMSLKVGPNDIRIPEAPYKAGRTRMLNDHAGSYEDVYKNFKFDLPATYNIGADITDKHARDKWDKTAIIFEDEDAKEARVTFGNLIQKSNQVANALTHKLGIQRGDRVAILMSQSPEAAICHAAIYKSGGVAVPLFVLFGPDAVKYRLSDSGATTVFVEPSKLDEVISLQKELPSLKNIVVTPTMSCFSTESKGYYDDPINQGTARLYSMNKLIENAEPLFDPVLTTPDDPALIIYTSGTTGPPKGALHAHRTLLGHLPGVEFPQNLFPQQDDLFWTPADWAWIGGLIDVLLPSLHHGVPVLAKRFKKFDPEQAFALMARQKVRNAFMPPTALKMMREVGNPKAKYDFKVRSIGCGGETLGEAVLQWGRETFGIDVNEFYGQTECNLVLGNCSRIMPVRPGSMGRPIPGHTVEICDELGNVLPVGSVGNIGIKAPHPVMFLEYLNKPQATKDKFAGGFLLTGDLGRKDQEGYFWYVGRSDDVIKSAGYRIGPSEIEDCLVSHPAVSNAAAVGVPDELRNEAVKAFVVIAPSHVGHSQDALRSELSEYVKTRLAKHEYPRQIEFVESLPMTTTGKVIRKDLKRKEYEKYYSERGLPCPKI